MPVPDRFGYEWSTYVELLPIHEQQFAQWSTPLGREDWAGDSFLDVGCGMGRNSYWPLKYGAELGVAIDADDRWCRRHARVVGRFQEQHSPPSEHL
jgi:hypothetical protein